MAHRAVWRDRAFGPDLDEDGCLWAEWLADSARMLWIVARAVLYRARRYAGTSFLPSLAYPDLPTAALSAAVAGEVERFVAGGLRRPLLRAMTQTWSGLTRGQAVTSVARIGLPWWCW